MSKYVFMALVLLSACSANGPAYSGQHGIIVYRDAPVELDSMPIEVDGRAFCSLKPRSFAVILKEHAVITASVFMRAGTSRIEAREGQVIHAGYDDSRQAAIAMGGVIGDALVSDNSGPVKFSLSDSSRLAGLHQDCM